MELPINPEPAEVMHIDLNSAFAMTEQQANPLLRGKPIGVTNRLNDWAICITASYEAKALGITIGTRYRDAVKLSKDFRMLESDPAKYKYVHMKMLGIFQDYSPSAYMKSIDEGIIDLRGMRKLLRGRLPEDIGREIKQRVKDEVGDYMTVNVGIGLNLWMAKLAAGLNKPDGLDLIDAKNLEVVLGKLSLTDLPYIAEKMRTRLVLAGIYTPLDMLYASEMTLKKQVFKSVIGSDWHLKIRGYETERHHDPIKTVGRSYVLEHRTSDPKELSTLLYKASVKVARRLYKNKLAARGLSLGLRYAQRDDHYTVGDNSIPGWFERHMFNSAVWRSDQLYERCIWLFLRSVPDKVVTHIYLTSYMLEPANLNQPRLWDKDEDARRDRIELAMDLVNDKYGELTLQPGSVLSSKNPMKDKIPFGTIRYFD